MGYDLEAYLDIDQEEVDSYLETHSIDKNDWDESERVGAYFFEKIVGMKVEDCRWLSMQPLYTYNESCFMHEVYLSHHSSFIRDDERFDNRRYQEMLEKKVGREFPWCLTSINWYVRKASDALEVARELRDFFADDASLMHFAGWLENTAKYCSTYDLSY